MTQTMDRRQRLFVWLAAIFVTAYVVGDIIGGRYFRIGHTDLSVAMIPFPLTFVLTDIVNEFYGPEGARRVTFLGLGMAVFALLLINLALILPASPESPIPAPMFERVMGNSVRLYVASLSAFVVGQLLDIASFQALRRITGHRFLAVRATGSTLASQLVDTAVVNGVFLGGIKPAGFVLGVIRDSYLLKVVIAIAMTPLIYLGHSLVRRNLEARAQEAEAAGRPIPP